MKHSFLALLAFVILLADAQGQSPRSLTTLTSGWRFSKGPQTGAYMKAFDDSSWKEVQVPHDWGVDGGFIADGDANTGKLPWKGEGWYRRTISIPATAEIKNYYLLFDGVMAFPHVYVNGQLAGKWDYGYNSFYIDVTPYILPGEDNVIAVHVDTREHDSRWYPGAGIYRKVQMLVVDPVHVDIWGTYITTPIVKPHYADVTIATSVVNAQASDFDTVLVRYRIRNDNGYEVAQKEQRISVSRNLNRTETTITIPNPRRWDIEHPNLYTVATEIYQGPTLLDRTEEKFGVRTIRFTANDGFYLNDRRVQLKGVCLHHDQGPLGAAFNTRAMERQLEIMQGMGCNAVRSSHNVPAPELLELCDRMGILVFDEIFDKYDRKADIMDTTDFAAFAERNVSNFVRRDRNHPSVFIWSVGNEIGDVQWNIKNGFWRLQTMINAVEKYDISRPNTLVCDSYGSAELRHFDYYDVHSWNYGRRYSLARQLEPGKPVIISESASTVSTRGFYELPLPEKKTDFTNALQVSSYDLNAPEWAEISDDDFMWQQEESYVAGEFVWTGFDYLGEPTPYDGSWAFMHVLPNTAASRSSYFGIVDLCGIPKDRYYLYKSYWKPEETTVHILPHWNWPDRVGKDVPVFVYTNGDCAELFLNDKSLGMRCKNPKSRNSIERFRLMWNDVRYEPGELRVVAYREGEVIGSESIKTAGAPHHLKLTTDRLTIDAGGSDLSYILVEALDEAGNICPLANSTVTVTIKGTATIAGVGNGNPQSLQAFKSNTIQLYNGKAMIIIQSALQPEYTSIEVSAPGIAGANEIIKSQ